MSSADSGDARVVIVEDNEEMANLLEIWLAADYTVDVAIDCASAHELIDESVDVVLLDRNLPDGSGDEVLTAVREAGYHCRVAMVTAVEPDFDIVEMGFDDYLNKPIEREQLHDVVERLLEQAAYDEDVQRLYALVTKKALLEGTYGSAVLEEREEYAALEAEIDALKAELAETAVSFTDPQFYAELQRL